MRKEKHIKSRMKVASTMTAHGVSREMQLRSAFETEPLLESAIKRTHEFESSTHAQVPDGVEKTPGEYVKDREIIGQHSAMENDESVINVGWTMQDETESENVPIGANGMLETGTSNSKKSSPEETKNLPAALLTEQLLNCEQEKLASTNLVDDALFRLSCQMKRVARSDQESPIKFDDKTEIDRARLACQTAMTMAKLVKLKIDAYKAFNDL